MQPATFLHTFYDHTCHLGHFALGVFLHYFFQLLHTTAGITVVQAAQTVDEDKLCTVFSHGETVCRDTGIASHFFKLVILEGGVGGSIERVFDMGAEAGIIGVVGIT